MPCTVDSPSPVPQPDLFGGEKRLEDPLPGGFVHPPPPVSVTASTRHNGPGAFSGVPSRTLSSRSTQASLNGGRPPRGMASLEFTARFINTCSN